MLTTKYINISSLTLALAIIGTIAAVISAAYDVKNDENTIIYLNNNQHKTESNTSPIVELVSDTKEEVSNHVDLNEIDEKKYSVFREEEEEYNHKHSSPPKGGFEFEKLNDESFVIKRNKPENYIKSFEGLVDEKNHISPVE